MNLLIKFPTRDRPDKFFSTLKIYKEYANNLNNIKFIISCDHDDTTMNNPEVKQTLENFGINYKLFYGNNKSKVEAINANMENLEFEVLLLASDDMIPQIKGYDEIILNDMEKKFPDLDGVLWYFDGYQKRLNTLSIMGKKYYDRFKFIYNPAYKSLWCDNEFMLISQYYRKIAHSDQVIIRHVHPSSNGCKYDELYKRNDSFNDIDRETFIKRYSQGFDGIIKGGF